MAKIRSRNNVKILDFIKEIGISEMELARILRELRIRMEEGQKNLDQQEAARVRGFLNTQRRRAELQKQTIALPPIIKVSELAERMELPIGIVQSTLLKMGVMATLNDDVDYETAAIIATELGYNTEERVEELEKDVLTPEKLDEILKKEDPKLQHERPPVVTIMGHVDHGKTTLLDTIRSANVAAGEAGGITQTISSYQVKYKQRLITFIDTPGHETFEFMRRRGASLADIAILVVAADDGVKPQTKEAVKHARAAGVPIVVAINKVDKPAANVDRVKGELAELDLTPEDWGGKTVTVPVSALKKKGIDDLLDMVLLTADVDPPKAIAERAALGSVIESRLDKHLGPLAAVLVHTGTLKVGDDVVVGRAAGRVRRLLDFRGKPLAAAGPSMPATIVGLTDVPQAGEVLQAVEATSEAKSKAAARRGIVKRVMSGLDDDERQALPLVIKADSHGSLEALLQTIEAMTPPEVRLSVIRADVGTVSDSDVLTAQAAGAIIYAFHTTVEGMSRRLADKEHVPVREFSVIYHLTEDVRKEIEERLPTELVREDLGILKVMKVFFSTQKRKIVGGEVTEGTIVPGAKVIVMRQPVGGSGDRTEIGSGEIVEMEREKKKLQRAEHGDQIGLTVDGKGKIKEGDVLKIYREEKVRKGSVIDKQ
ncbi:MAG: translation initiation factor IF-2 [Candidatus Magasanikbacteria bacterium CG10_big_fil_rev_8_21_14_0_10_47_10]|uniref:Translation initiation factor IF-2 n=1 Tax=Candidatus Magasanikbacteria bacterium CG10_big_fil_rev_8_21_14_0_10_47_10 TaxID=1974652 RepID=A0A2H0TTB3_9BACT|nr:MAG: translation initiation factor IF-2 [Candidatus Magasanikbacteria bacterium CG10_big_fil_rev_8_21_14_0_10_47_10]